MTEKEKYDYLIKSGYYVNDNGKVISKKGNEIGTIRKKKDYKRIVFCYIFDKKRYHVLAHRFVYYFFKNEIPDVVDHINCDATDNRIENLRSVSHTQNMWNLKNAKGYYYDKRKRKFLASICVNGERKRLGNYITEDDAKSAYQKAKENLHIFC